MRHDLRLWLLVPVLGVRILVTKSFKRMVREKMTHISDKIANRSPHEDIAGIIGFLNTTPYNPPHLQNISSGNQFQVADILIGRYQELIAAKYAEIYIQRAVSDLRAALTKFSVVADATQTQELEKLKPTLDEISHAARQVLSTAYSQTISTYNIGLEVQYSTWSGY